MIMFPKKGGHGSNATHHAKQKLAEAQAIAIEALSFLSAEEERLERFFALSGLDHASLRDAAREPGFLGAVLDHYAADEPLLIAFAQNSGRDPMVIIHAQQTLAHEGLAQGDDF